MLVIRKEQMEAFDQAQLKDFENRMVKHLRESFPDETRRMSEGQLRTLIQRGVRIARRYEITRECDVSRYLDLMVTLSPSFDHERETAWTLPILQDASMDPEEKLDMIYERVIFGEEGIGS